MVGERFDRIKEEVWYEKKYLQIERRLGYIPPEYTELVKYMVRAEAKIEKRVGCYCTQCVIRAVEEANWALELLLEHSPLDAKAIHRDYRYVYFLNGMRSEVAYAYDDDKRYEAYWRGKQSG